MTIRVALFPALAACVLAAITAPGPRDLEAAQPPAPPAGQLQEVARPRLPRMDDAEVAGLPAGSRPEILNWERVYRLALARSRSARQGESGSFSETLDPEALEDQSRRFGLADFARFRDDFLKRREKPADGAAGTFRDPSVAFFEVLRRRQRVETARRNVGIYEH